MQPLDDTQRAKLAINGTLGVENIFSLGVIQWLHLTSYTIKFPSAPPYFQNYKTTPL